jgi:hypothetical protein
MRIHDIIRSVLDIIDQVDSEPKSTAIDQPDDTPSGYCDDDLARFKQIAGIVTQPGEMSPLSNSPNEKVADIAAVTIDAGGGVNGPKHPHDLRVKDPSMYPNQQEI